MLVKALRKIVDSNKGFVTFWLVMVFLGALCIKNASGATAVKKGKYNIAHSGYKYQLTTTPDDDFAAGFFDRLEKDFDADDTEFIILEYTSVKLISNFGKTSRFTTADSCKQGYNKSLYDLYCNWKFHLS